MFTSLSQKYARTSKKNKSANDAKVWIRTHAHVKSYTCRPNRFRSNKTMLRTQHAQLHASTKQISYRLVKEQIEYYQNNFSLIGTQAALIGGFSFSLLGSEMEATSFTGLCKHPLPNKHPLQKHCHTTRLCCLFLPLDLF